jgi:hypothetical protein
VAAVLAAVPSGVQSAAPSPAQTKTQPTADAQAGWLDRPMSPWQQGVVSVPTPGPEPYAALVRRCGSSAVATSVAADAIAKAGWVPFLHLDRQITGGDVEVIGGMSAASPGCEAAVFNLFVFAGGRFAGTIAPVTMAPSRDGVAGAVRITGADALTAEFARYTPADAECCPSSRVRVTYRIDQRATRPTLVAIGAQQIR